MRPGLITEILVGYTALASLGSVFSPWFRDRAFRRLPFSRLTCGLLFVLCIHVLLLGFLKFHEHNILRSAFHGFGILMVVLFLVSMGRDFYLARNRPKKIWLLFGFIMLAGFLASRIYISSKANVHASEVGLHTNSAPDSQ
jgi:FtsH-binding integral membrane protein